MPSGMPDIPSSLIGMLLPTSDRPARPPISVAGPADLLLALCREKFISNYSSLESMNGITQHFGTELHSTSDPKLLRNI